MLSWQLVKTHLLYLIYNDSQNYLTISFYRKFQLRWKTYSFCNRLQIGHKRLQWLQNANGCPWHGKVPHRNCGGWDRVFAYFWAFVIFLGSNQGESKLSSTVWRAKRIKIWCFLWVGKILYTEGRFVTSSSKTSTQTSRNTKTENCTISDFVFLEVWVEGFERPGHGKAKNAKSADQMHSGRGVSLGHPRHTSPQHSACIRQHGCLLLSVDSGHPLILKLRKCTKVPDMCQKWRGGEHGRGAPGLRPRRASAGTGR